jgi:cytoskeletal protein RodZ
MNDESRTAFGPFLRQAREQRGVSLQQVAATTKISARVLDALERNDTSKLPGGLFSRSFVRAYAREVGLDPEETVSRFIEAFPPDTDDRASAATSRFVDVESFESGRRTAIVLLQILGLSLLVIVAVLVYRNMHPVVQVPAEPPPIPAPAETRSQGPTTIPAGVDVGAEAEPVGTIPAIDAPAQTQGAQSLPASPPPAGVPTGSAEPVAATPETPIAVSVLAGEECWLSLRVDGQKVVARNLRPGERVQFRARSVITLWAGNAGALTLTLNGKPARTLGARGEVVTKTITLDSLNTFFQ